MEKYKEYTMESEMVIEGRGKDRWNEELEASTRLGQE